MHRNPQKSTEIHRNIQKLKETDRNRKKQTETDRAAEKINFTGIRPKLAAKCGFKNSSENPNTYKLSCIYQNCNVFAPFMAFLGLKSTSAGIHLS